MSQNLHQRLARVAAQLSPKDVEPFAYAIDYALQRHSPDFDKSKLSEQITDPHQRLVRLAPYMGDAVVEAIIGTMTLLIAARETGQRSILKMNQRWSKPNTKQIVVDEPQAGHGLRLVPGLGGRDGSA